MKWQPLADPNALLDHALFIIEVKPGVFKHVPPFYGIMQLSDGTLGAREVTGDTPLFNGDGDESGYAVAHISRWMPFDPKEHE